MSKDSYTLGNTDLSGFTQVLLYRHGKTDGRPQLPESDRGLSDAGVEAVQQTARRLVEEWMTGRGDLTIDTVLYGNYQQVRETARIVHDELASQLCALAKEGSEVPRTSWTAQPVSELDPSLGMFRGQRLTLDPFKGEGGKGQAPGTDTATTAATRASTDKGKHVAKTDSQKPSKEKVLLIFGHEPQLSDISRELLRVHVTPGRRLPGRRRVVTPSGGVSCFSGGIGLANRPRLRWVIEPADEDTTELLREKIRSKIDVAKVFGAVITLALGIILKALIDREPTPTPIEGPDWLAVAAGVLGFALVLYIAVLYAYDSLLMPPRFLSASRRRSAFGRRTVARPPSSLNLVMQQNMVWIWKWPFTLANVLVVTSFGLLAWGTIGIPGSWVIGATAVAAVLAYWAGRVDLGTQD